MTHPLTTLRLRRKLSQYRLSKLTRVQVGRIESGKHLPNMQTRIDLLKFFRIAIYRHREIFGPMPHDNRRVFCSKCRNEIKR